MKYEKTETLARAICRYHLRMTFTANSAEWIESRVDVEWVMHTQAADEALEALESTDEQRALRAKLADCQAVIRSRGHAEGCPARHCSFVGFTGRCGESPAWHKVVKVGHEYQSPPCYESCGHDRTTGEKA